MVWGVMAMGRNNWIPITVYSCIDCLMYLVLKIMLLTGFKSYLCSRTCRVKIASDFSDPKVL